MNLQDQYRLLLGGYYGVREMDEYSLKEYVLQDIENYIKTFLAEHHNEQYDHDKIMEELEQLPLKRKLQDALIVLNKMNGSIELVLLIKKKLKEIHEQEMTMM